MGVYKYLKKAFSTEYKERSQVYRSRVAAWRKARPVERTESPLNPRRAHALGYRAKKEFIVARARVAKGRRRVKEPDLGRKPGRRIKYRALGFSLQQLAEQRTVKRFRNLRVVGSYFVGEDGSNKYFEVILRNPV